ncbi:MAG TPA: acyl-CoA dehydrogenase family protein [Acidimicrobiales bacterium]|nr:acyl-CoA dehydrogenase family protein [Acidimicrobiales bacterium]
MSPPPAPADAAPGKRPPYLVALEPVVADVVAPMAADVDRHGTYPRPALDALGAAGLLGLVSSPEVGGMGGGYRAAAGVVQELARNCASTAMVVLMHYAATAVLEAHGATEVREAIAAGRFVGTLAFSEAGSRSHFWVPTSSATAVDGQVRLDAAKSWVTSAGEADGYVWSSRPVAAEGPSTLWLVPGGAAGLSVGAPFDGLGLRGNKSSPMVAEGVVVGSDAMLGPDGGGFEVMIGAILPWFQVMNAAFSTGTADVATNRAAAYVAGTRVEHLDQSLAENPTTRAYVARMRISTDAAEALLLDTLAALETGRADATLRVLEVKAAASEAAAGVTDLAMRVCGGSAFRKEVGVERNFRDARAATVMAPTTDALYDFVGRVACGLPVF